MKRSRFLVLAMVLTMICATFAFVGCNNDDNTTEPDKALVSININPSVEMVVNSDNMVVSVAAKNEDAQIMLYGEEGLLNVSVETATNKILELAIEYGYITQENSGISVCVSGETASFEDDLKTKISATIGNFDTTISLNVSTDLPFSVERKWEEFKSQNPKYSDVTASKFALALNACAYDTSLDMEAAVDMDAEQLIEICESGENKISTYATAAYQAVYNSASVAFNLARDTANFGIYTVKYVELMTQKASGLEMITAGASAGLEATKLVGLTTVQYALQSAIYVAEQIAGIELDQELAEQFATSLDVDIAQLQNSEGKVTVESIDAYCDKLLKNASDEQKASVLAKLNQIKDNLSAAEEQAVQDMMQDEASAYGQLKKAVEGLGEFIEGFDINKLTDIDSYKALLADVVKAKENTKATMDGKLTDEDKEIIANAQADVKAVIDNAESEFEAAIEEAKAAAEQYLQNAQQQRKAQLQ
ncbi:MAG: hypothetical protein ACI4MI_05350 [Christensenellales bacterium]